MSVQAHRLFHLLADPTRLRLTLLLASQGRLCVCELQHAIDEPQPKISRHLAAMRDAGLVAGERHGQWVHYRIHPDLPDWARAVIERTLAGVGEQPPFADDRRTLADMPNRPGAACTA